MEWIWLIIGFIFGRLGKFILLLAIVLILIGLVAEQLN